MKNQQVARTLEKIADLMEIEGGDSYRARAYRRAAAQIAGLAESLEDIARRGALTEIPGIGPSIAQKVRDIIETGTTSVYEELKTRVPEGLTSMLDIPGLGPKTVRTLYERLGVRTVDELEQAAREQRIRRETELGNKTELNILRGIEVLRRRDGRMSLGLALPMIEDILERLRRTPGVRRASEAGSARRRKETVGDFDMVVETTDPQAATDAFIHLPQVAEVIEAGPSMVSAINKHALRMDLRIADAQHFGAVLHHFTGAKEHNIRLRAMARERGLTISEYGVFRTDTGEEVTTGRLEEEVYAALGLPWIPPELREDQGEIEAAKEGRLPCLIEEHDILGDLHVHTSASDGRNTILEIAEAAQARGYRYIAICDHSKSLAIASGLDEDRLLRQVDEIRELNESLDGFTVLAGIEVDILKDGRLDIDSRIISHLDIVVGSIHHRYKLDRARMTDRILSAINTGCIDVLAHPLGRIIGTREAYDVDIDRVFEAALAHSTAMEINATPDRLDMNDAYCRAAKAKGLKVAISTDAHSIPELPNIRFGLAMARRGWLEPPDVLNTLPLPDLMAWLCRRRG